jgi:Cd2+/Zn2+-exporting ATPase
MSAAVKKELILEGLHCAHCAVKIEGQISKIENVSLASINFATKTLTIKSTAAGNISAIIGKAKDIIQKLEPDVVVREKMAPSAFCKKTLILKGLDCAHCASKIETATGNIKGVKCASVDFVSKKLIIEAENSRDLERIVAEASALAGRIEAGIEVTPEASEPTQVYLQITY